MQSPTGGIAVNGSPLFLADMAEIFDRLTNANALYRAYLLSRKDCDWKGSVQRYGANLLVNIRNTQKELRCGKYEQKPFVEFTLHERGKTRRIKSMHIYDRVVQRVVCDEALIPALTPYLIYDNGASLKGKGISFVRDRFQCHLEKHIRKYGNDGWILKGDFSKFFDNIDHELAIKSIARRIDDPLAMRLIQELISSFSVDVSGINCDFNKEPYNSLKHKGNGSGEKVLNRSVGIGSQISQIIGIYYPTPIDTYCKTVMRCKFYGRYMDDFYVIHHDKEFLKTVLEGIRKISKDLKLFINDKKTKIIPISRGFTFLQIKYNITKSGEIIKRVSSSTFSRERRRLKKYSGILNKQMSRREVCNAYQSWRCNLKQFKARASVRKMDRLYNHLFVEN